MTRQTSPTRLLEVGRHGDVHIRLVEGEGTRSAPYIALTYCWGGDVSVKTTLANLHDMASGISISTLPQVFQDAIQITRDLGVSYLWIDAMCILQDSPADWELESARMADVYSQAFLTIAAASSTAASQGFIRERPPTREFAVDWISDDGSPTLVKGRLDPTGNFLVSHRPELPWSLRGWTLQEHVLSTRVVMFSDIEIQWSCQSSQHCECRGLDNFMHRFIYASIHKMQSPRAVYRYWQNIVASDYSKRELTQGQDKLPALSGIASVVSKQTGSDYVAGLWADNLIRDLCWYRNIYPQNLEKKPSSLPREYRAPSFSWASIEDEIIYARSMEIDTGVLDGWSGEDEWVSKSECCDTFSRVIGQNPYGRVSDAWVKLQGPLVPCVLRGTALDRRRCWLIYGQKGRLLDIDDDLDGFSFHAPDGTLQFSAARRSSLMAHGSNSSACPAMTTDDCLELPAWALFLGSFGDGLWSRQEYLIVGRSIKNPSQYERVGLYEEPGDSKQVFGCQLFPDEGFLETTITIV